MPCFYLDHLYRTAANPLLVLLESISYRPWCSVIRWSNGWFVVPYRTGFVFIAKHITGSDTTPTTTRSDNSTATIIETPNLHAASTLLVRGVLVVFAFISATPPLLYKHKPLAFVGFF